MKFTIYNTQDAKLYELENKSIGAVPLGKLFSVPFYKVHAEADIIDSSFGPFASISWHIARNNSKTVVISSTRDLNGLIVSLFDAENNIFRPQTWEEVMEWGA